MNIESARNPVWADSQETGINIVVKFSHIGEELRFFATPTDVEQHGRDLFRRAVMGEFGPVAPYVEPVVEPAPLSTTASNQMQPVFPTPATGSIPTITFE